MVDDYQAESTPDVIQRLKPGSAAQNQRTGCPYNELIPRAFLCLFAGGKCVYLYKSET